jgi:hypothetical protein
MKKLIIKLFGFELMQYKWGRKYIGGTFFQIYTVGTPLTQQIFWSDVEITSCQSRTLKIENYQRIIEGL